MTDLVTIKEFQEAFRKTEGFDLDITINTISIKEPMNIMISQYPKERKLSDDKCVDDYISDYIMKNIVITNQENLISLSFEVLVGIKYEDKGPVHDNKSE